MVLIKALLMSFCVWCDNSWFGHGVRDSVWLFPFVEIFHLLALGVLGGTIIILNLRLLGVRFHDEPIAELASDIQPVMIGSLAVMLVSGFFLFSSESVKMYGNWAFRFKMVSLLVAILYTFTLYRKVTFSHEAEISPVWLKLTAVISFLLWAGVGLGGRAIGYV